MDGYDIVAGARVIADVGYLDHISCPGAIAVEEHDQPFHYRPAHPEIFLVGLMPVVVYHRHRAFIRLYVVEP